MIKQYKNKSKFNFFLFFIILICISFSLIFYLYEPTNSISYSYNNFSYVKMLVPAIDENNKGVITELIVQTIPGDGKILTNIDKLIFWVDTQDSIQVAKKIATDITKINTDNIDIIYTIKANNASLIGGYSAGAALTIATVAALKNVSINENIIITGTIEEDGSIGEVSGIFEKAKAVKNAGGKLFLIPEANFKEENYIPIEKCINYNEFEICEKRYEKRNIKNMTLDGIEIIAVSNIHDALKYFGL